MTKLIALHSSVPQSGKSTVANILYLNHDFYTVPFALSIKRMVTTFLLEAEIGLNYPESMTKFIENYKSSKISELNLDLNLCHVTVRNLMQTLGTEWGRTHVHPDIWIMLWTLKAQSYFNRNVKVCVDDLRFANEALAVRNLGGEIWKIVRPEHNVDHSIINHASEHGLDDKLFDRVIINDGSIDDLKNKIADIFKLSKVYF